MKRALITGIRGFAGSWLAAELLNHGYQVCGIDRKGLPIKNAAAQNSLTRQSTFSSIRIFADDLSSQNSLSEIFSEERPDLVFHLAGTAFVPDSWKSPLASLTNNVSTSLCLMEAAQKANWRGRFLFVSSSDVYGMPSSLPITEESPCAPQSPYALSKLTAERYLEFYSKDGVELVIARPFNHSGPGQRQDFVIPAFIERVRAAKAKGKSSILVGDLDAIRDFSDVRDVVRAYRLIAERGEVREAYNICTGQQTRIGELLQIVLDVAQARLDVETDPTLLREEGTSIRYGSPEKLCGLGWSPAFSLEDTIRDIWNAPLSFS